MKGLHDMMSSHAKMLCGGNLSLILNLHGGEAVLCAAVRQVCCVNGLEASTIRVNFALLGRPME